MIALKKNGTVECCCGTIYTFAEELVEKVLPILDYAIDVKFNDLNFIVTKDDTVLSIVNKWRKASENQRWVNINKNILFKKYW